MDWEQLKLLCVSYFALCYKGGSTPRCASWECFVILFDTTKEENLPINES